VTAGGESGGTSQPQTGGGREHRDGSQRSHGELIMLVGEGHAVPFSKGILATTLTATGLPPERAFTVALDVEWQLLGEKDHEVSVERLRHMVEVALAEVEGQLYVERYRKWDRLGKEDRPVIILVGGATGVGKSTLATQLMERLGLVRLISTDTIREVMRAFFSRSLMPAIHYSSYDADRAVRIPLGEGLDSHVAGFMEQMEMVNVGLQAVLARAIQERTSMVIEGVHIVPGMMTAQDLSLKEALILPMVVTVADPDLHRGHFLVRERETSGRRAVMRYLKGFDDIRKIQDFIVQRAQAEGTLIVDNVSIDDAVGTVVEALYDLIERTEGQADGKD
jgi:2-phosphoglycerate kinase